MSESWIIDDLLKENERMIPGELKGGDAKVKDHTQTTDKSPYVQSAGDSTSPKAEPSKQIGTKRG